MSKRVVDVGQCGFDHASIAGLLKREFAAEVVAADGPADALAALGDGPCDLVLVNRRLDADGSDGLDVIRLLKANPQYAAVPVMLVSNYPEYQQQAMQAGAEPGFGKLELSRPETRSKLARFLS